VGSISPKFWGAIFVLVVVIWIYSSIAAQWAAMENDLRLAITMVVFVWILNWARKNLGSPRLAIVYALVIAYIIFFKHPEAIWWVVGLLILSIVGPKVLEGFETKGPGSKPADKAAEIKAPYFIYPVPLYPYYPGYPPPGQQGEQKK